VRWRALLCVPTVADVPGPAKFLRPLILLALMAAALGTTTALAQSDEPPEGDSCAEGCPTAQFAPCTHRLACDVQEVQQLKVLYRYGQSVRVECDDKASSASPPCPSAGDVDIKVTVLPSVAKVLHSGTTISESETTARLGKEISPDPDQDFDSHSQYYFVKLKPSIVRRMKAIKVNMISTTVSGTVAAPDGSKAAIKSKLSTSAFPGNCSGQDLHIQRRLTYGGHCEAF